MRRDATAKEKAVWKATYSDNLMGFVPCIGGYPEGVVHWSATVRRRRGDVCHFRLCDMVGDWKPVTNVVVDCMTCLVVITKYDT